MHLSSSRLAHVQCTSAPIHYRTSKQPTNSQLYQFFNVLKYRRAAKVKYPAVYASEAEAAADPKKMVSDCTRSQRSWRSVVESSQRSSTAKAGRIAKLARVCEAQPTMPEPTKQS